LNTSLGSFAVFGELAVVGGGEVVGLVIGFESAEFAMKGTFGGVFVAQEEVMHFDLVGREGVHRETRR
jgi:hypothetical protein